MNNENFKLLDKTKKTANYIKNITINIPKSERILKDSIHNAIFYYEVTPHQKCYFYINNDNNFIVYTLKNSYLKKTD